MSTHVLGRPSSRLDHMTEAGDRVSHSYQITAFGADGRPLVGVRVIQRMSGALAVQLQARPDSVRDDDRDLRIQLMLLDNARDAINANRFSKEALQVPGKDIAIEGLDIARITVSGPLDERAHALTVLNNAKTILSDEHAAKKLLTGDQVTQVAKL